MIGRTVGALHDWTLNRHRRAAAISRRITHPRLIIASARDRKIVKAVILETGIAGIVTEEQPAAVVKVRRVPGHLGGKGEFCHVVYRRKLLPVVKVCLWHSQIELIERQKER